MSKLYFMVGLPGSGKTTYSKELVNGNKNAVILSSDAIREEFGWDGGDKSKHGQVFSILEDRCVNLLNNDYDVVYDATNISSKKRIGFLRNLKNRLRDYDSVYKECIIVCTPYQICLNQNEMRKERVPKEVIDRMYESWQTPIEEEGWDSVVCYYPNISYKNSNGSVFDYFKSVDDYDQGNSHHAFTLGDHIARVGLAVKKMEGLSREVVDAAFIHDCGKPFTRGQKVKEDGTVESIYYNHANVGSYEALFFSYPKGIDISYVAFLVNHHMDPFSWKKDSKGRTMFESRYGDKALKDILALHYCDRNNTK